MKKLIQNRPLVLAAQARGGDAEATLSYSAARARREQELLVFRATSRDLMEAKQTERQVAEARLDAIRADLDASQHEPDRYRRASNCFNFFTQKEAEKCACAKSWTMSIG